MNWRREPPSAGVCPVQGKMRWKGRRAAKMVRARMNESQRSPGAIYRCRHCGDWHITKHERWKAPA